MSRILVAISSPWAAQKAVEPVSSLAKQLSAEVLVLHVSRPSGGQLREQEQDDGDKSIETLKGALEARSIVVQTLLMFSEDIAQAILDVAEERAATVILLGLTGKNVFARLLAGNIPAELIKNTKIPVLLLPPDWNGGI